MRRFLGIALLALCTACSSGKHAEHPTVADRREDGRSSSDGEVVAEWLLAELSTPGGKPKEAVAARKRLDQRGAKGLLAELARGLDDSLHGRLKDVSGHYLRAVERARESNDPRAPLFA